MGGCLTSVPKEQVAKEEELVDQSSETPKSSVTLKSLKTTRTNMARFYLKFPKINKAYQHLFKGWCDAIGKHVSEGATAAEIFNLEGPSAKASDALSRAGIITTNDAVIKALENELASPRESNETLRFKDLILAVCWIIKNGGDSLKQSGDSEKYDQIMFGFKIVRDMFAQIDVDDSGEISLQEFTEAFSDLSHGGDNNIYEKRMGELDFNDDKEISYPEFCVGMSVWVGFVDEFE